MVLFSSPLTGRIVFVFLFYVHRGSFSGHLSYFSLLLSGYNVPTRVAPNFVLRILGLFSGSVKMILPSLGCEQKFDNSKVLVHIFLLLV